SKFCWAKKLLTLGVSNTTIASKFLILTKNAMHLIQNQLPSKHFVHRVTMCNSEVNMFTFGVISIDFYLGPISPKAPFLNSQEVNKLDCSSRSSCFKTATCLCSTNLQTT